MIFSDGQARMSQGRTNRRKLKDEQLQRLSIIGDEDGFWLIHRIEELRSRDATIRSGRAMRFSFLDDSGEAVLPQLEVSEAGIVIAMPAGCIIRRHEGNDFETWIFRVDNGLSGRDREYFDLAYRKIAIDAYLLYLKAHCPSR